MATGGEANYSCCSSCLDDGRNTVARHYCVDCEMYFCTKCVKYHNKIPATKTHQVNEVNSPESADADVDTKNLQSDVLSDSVQGLRCTLHQEKLIDTFCKDHNEVCCGSCAMVKHRLCTSVPIAVAANNFTTSPERTKCKEALGLNIVRLNEVKQKRVENLDNIGKQKLELIENVDEYEEKNIAKIKELANNSRKEIRSKYDEHKEALDMDIATLDVAIATNTEYTEQLEKRDDEIQFIYVKTNKTVTKDEELLLQSMTADYRELEIRYIIDETLDNHFVKMKSCGVFNEDCAVKEYKATFHRNINVKQINDLNHDYVRDICRLDSGELLVTGDGNQKLKRFNSDFQFKDEIRVSGDPIAVCKINEHEVAMRILNTKVVQFVSVGRSMKLTSSFTLAYNGWGLAYDADIGELFACEKNKVSVYSKTGNKLRTYDKDINGEQMFPECRQIALSLNNQDIYVTDLQKGLIVLDKSGTLKMKVSLSGVTDVNPVCLLPGGICLAGSNKSGVIVQLDKDGKQVGNLIDSNDGRKQTWCAVYDRERSRLIVGGYPNTMSVYSLSVK